MYKLSVQGKMGPQGGPHNPSTLTLTHHHLCLHNQHSIHSHNPTPDTPPQWGASLPHPSLHLLLYDFGLPSQHKVDDQAQEDQHAQQDQHIWVGRV